MIHMPFLYVWVLKSQCEAHGLLRTVEKQFFVNAKDLCDTYLLYQHSQYASFDRPNKTDVIIIREIGYQGDLKI